MRFWTGFLSVFLAIAMVQTSFADVKTFTSSHDATIFSNSNTNSDGGGPGMFVGTDGTGTPRRGLIEFEVAGNIPAGSTITAVKLTLRLAQVAGEGVPGKLDANSRTIDIHRLIASWGEGTKGTGTTIDATGGGFGADPGDATWRDRFYSSTAPVNWTTAGGDFTTTANDAKTTVGNNSTSSPPIIWSSSSMISDVQGWLTDPSTNFGWVVQSESEATVRTYRAFWTREAADGFQPQLEVTYTPEPTTLIPIALAGWALVRRRSR